MLKIIRRPGFLTGANSGVVLLVVAALGTILFTVLACALVFGSTRELISSASWVQHTQEVLASLQRVSLLTERIEYRTRLYALTGNEEQLRRAQSSGNQLETTLAHLRTLISDNPDQAARLRDLDSCSQQLNGALAAFTVNSEISSADLQQCQQAIGLMTDREQSLLQQRSKGAERNSFASIGTEAVFAVLSLGALVVLFGFLIRDARRRQTVGRETTLANGRLAQTVKALEDRAGESALLTWGRDELQLCVDVQQIYRSAANSFSRLLEGTSGSLLMINNSRQLVEVVSTWQSEDAVSRVEDFHPPESCCGLRSGHARWRQPGVSEIHCTHFRGEAPERYLCVPIVAHGNTVGMLYVQCPTSEVVAHVNQRMDGLIQVLQLTGMAVAALNLRTKLENQSIRDGLTGLFNRHFMQISLDRELSRAERRKQTLAVFMLDLDHFKRFNDRYGHAAGDSALKAVADIFHSNIRKEDIACRYGGEEFTIMMPDVTPNIALQRAEKIREAIANLQLPLEQGSCDGFSVSIGVALYPEDGESAELLLRRADLALYRAKHSGRNRVVQYDNGIVVA